MESETVPLKARREKRTRGRKSKCLHAGDETRVSVVQNAHFSFRVNCGGGRLSCEEGRFC